MRTACTVMALGMLLAAAVAAALLFVPAMVPSGARQAATFVTQKVKPAGEMHIECISWI